MANMAYLYRVPSPEYRASITSPRSGLATRDSRLLLPPPQAGDDLLHQGVGIALVFGDLGGVAGHGAVAHAFAQDALQQRVAQHFHQAVAPILHLLTLGQVLL